MLFRIHIIISGDVQGVGYRYFASRLAEQSNITGWVKNNSDGTVELEAEGEKENLLQYIEKLKTEHLYANVRSLETTWLPSQNKFNTFTVKF